MTKTEKEEPKLNQIESKSLLKNLKKRQVGFGAAAAVFVTIFAYLASQFLAGIFIGLWATLSNRDVNQVFDELGESTGLQFAFFLIVEAITLYIIWVFLKSRNNSFKDIGMARKPGVKDLWPAISTFAVYFLVLIVVTQLIGALVPSIDADQEQVIGFEDATTTFKLVLVFISLVILPPIVEEIVARGFLYTGLSKTFKRNIAAVIASLLFAIAHLQLGSGNPPLWIAAVDTFILSLFLIHLREKTGAIWSGMLVHAIKNGLAFLLLFVIKIPGL